MINCKALEFELEIDFDSLWQGYCTSPHFLFNTYSQGAPQIVKTQVAVKLRHTLRHSTCVSMSFGIIEPHKILPVVGRCSRLRVAGFGRAVLRCSFGGPHGCHLRCRLAGGFSGFFWSRCAASRLCVCLLPPPLFFCAVCLFPPLFWGGGGGSACSSLCLPRSASGMVNWVAVGACGLLGRAPPPWVSGLCTRLARWPFLSGQVLALPAGRLRQAVS